MIAKVASIYFQPLSWREPMFGGVFDIPAVPKGGDPFILTIPDHTQWEQQPFILGGGRRAITIMGQEIAASNVKIWAHNGLGMTGDCGPGVWVVREHVPVMEEDKNGNLVVRVNPLTKKAEYREATAEEKAEMWAQDLAEQTARQEKWGETLIQQGEELNADPEKKKGRLISPTMRAAAIYYGRDVEWLDRTIRTGDRKKCQFCGGMLDVAVLKCRHCGEIVDQRGYEAAKRPAPLPPPVKKPEPQPVA